jgi:hypothetical protein
MGAEVMNAAHILPGYIQFGIEGSDKIPLNLPTLLLSKEISDTEFTSARSYAATSRPKISIEQKWLDADTYKLTSVADDQKAFDAVTLADVKALAQRLAKNPVVAVTVIKAEKAATNN